MEPLNKSRPYRMSNRTRQARETRRRIVEAAARLFVSEGYSATSVGAIAEAAEVAVPTVYATLRSKANILRAVIELTVRGDDDAGPIADSGAWSDIEREDDPTGKLALFARLHREICDREATIFAQLEAAAGADEEATEMLAEHDRLRLTTQSRLARSLGRRKQLKRGLSDGEAADIIWTLASERTYLALVHKRGWEAEKYERWVAEQLVAALLPRP